jgi:S1-C subfamily serine protease
MKSVFFICIFILMLGVAAAQQSLNNLTDTASIASDAEIKQIRLIAEKGDSAAQLVLGNFEYLTTNYTDAVKWYQKSAEQGVAGAQAQLGICYQNGFGVPKDNEQCVKWYRRAANQGEKYGQAMLGLCYGSGRGVPLNDVEAYKWLILANSHEWRDDDSVRKIIATPLKVCEERMSRGEIAEAQRLSREFIPRKEKVGSNDANSNSPEPPTATGTGFFISDDGYLISNNHVVEGATKVRVVTSAGIISAKVVRADAANDLALLKVTGRFLALPVMASRSVKLGGTVATVGFPNIGLQGFAPKLAKGEIASLSGAGDDARYFQISVPVQPGNSGGALVDERGNVVGVVSAKLNAKAALESSGALPENVNYAVKSSFLLSFLESVPDVANKLKEPGTSERKFEDVVKSAQDAAVLVLVY